MIDPYFITQDNFSKGVYPTLQQRADFMSDACDYVKRETKSATTKCINNDCQREKRVISIISFSFVNTDLRTAFTNVFPEAQWILVDTHKRLAEERIAAREGHFYKNASGASDTDSNAEDDYKDEAQSNDANTNKDKSEWEFAPVDFPHIVLNGNDAVEVNVRRVIECIKLG